MADGGIESDVLTQQPSLPENTDINNLEFANNSDQPSPLIVSPTSKMNRLIQKVRATTSYLWSQCPGFMLIFYLCYLYFGSIIFIVLSVLSVAAFLYTIQDSLLYQPNVPSNSRHFVMTPEQFGLPFEDIFLTTRDGVSIHAYFIKQPLLSTAYTMLVLHGNAGNIGHRLYNCQFLYQQCNVNIMLLEYRGYGRSQGSPSEQGLTIDATTALDHLLSRNDINHHKILIFGRSLGGAVAIATATKFSPNSPYPSSSPSITFHPNFSTLNRGGGFPAGVILENTFTNIREMARDMVKIPFVSYLPEFLIKNKFNSLEAIVHLQAPTLFISGQQDEIVPPPMMLSLYEKSSSFLKRLFKLANGSHNECWRLPGYYQTISDFILEIEQLGQQKE